MSSLSLGKMPSTIAATTPTCCEIHQRVFNNFLKIGVEYTAKCEKLTTMKQQLDELKMELRMLPDNATRSSRDRLRNKIKDTSGTFGYEVSSRNEMTDMLFALHKMCRTKTIHKYGVRFECDDLVLEDEHRPCFITVAHECAKRPNGIVVVYNFIRVVLRDAEFMRYFIACAGIPPNAECILPHYVYLPNSYTRELNECHAVLLREIQQNNIKPSESLAKDRWEYKPHDYSGNPMSSCRMGEKTMFENYEPLLPSNKIMPEYAQYLPAGWQLIDGILISP